MCTKMDLLITPNPALENLPPYSVGRPDQGIDLVLDFNENTVAQSSLPPNSNRYPDLQSPLEARIADVLGVDSGQVLVTCGADDALQRAVFAVCAPGREAILLEPAYTMIRRFVDLSGSVPVQVEWWTGDLPVSEINKSTTERTALIAVVSPANPTGTVATSKALTGLLKANPTTLVLVDQAYFEFADDKFDLLSTVLRHCNAVMIRTFSKAWGAAGLRVGYAVGDAGVIGWMRRIGLPFPVSRPAEEMTNSLLTTGLDRDRVFRIRIERDQLQALLQRLGVETWPSQGNFVLARFTDAGLVWKGLTSFGISIRRFVDNRQLDDCLRFTLPGDEEAFERLESALATILTPQALIFDMDGVLADVSRSYRSAIKAAALTYGITVSDEAIRNAKAKGEAANDWRLTQKLLAQSGIEAPLDEVTARFESAYQGTPIAPGLRRFERPILDRKELEALANRCPLAIVTGRPRGDAERFLDEHHLSNFFEVVVCMEDATSKPDPAPIEKALCDLRVTRAWMVGDTPDDVASALAAGVLPVGVPAPGDPVGPSQEVLKKAGAAFVLSSPAQISEVLP